MYVLYHRLPQYLSIRRISSKYHAPAQVDQQQKHPTPSIDCFTNSMRRVSGEVYTNRFKLELSLADKHYVNNSGFHS